MMEGGPGQASVCDWLVARMHYIYSSSIIMVWSGLYLRSSQKTLQRGSSHLSIPLIKPLKWDLRQETTYLTWKNLVLGVKQGQQTSGGKTCTHGAQSGLV